MKIDPCLLYIGTESGMSVYLLDSDLRLKLIGKGLEGNAVRGIAIHPTNPEICYIACGLRGWGLYRTEDMGNSFASLGFSDRWVWDVVLERGNPEKIWVGTEPPMLYYSSDGGSTFQAKQSIESLSSRKHWHFFHPPFYAGHIHGIEIHPDNPQRIYAGIEQGGLIYSYDGGTTWQETLIGKDLHRIAIHPTNPDHLFAGAGEGLFVSTDGGRNWTPVSELQGKYIHAVICDSRNPDCWFLYADDRNYPIYRSDDNGTTWRCIGNNLPPAQPADSLVLHPSHHNVLIYGGDTGNRKSGIFLSTNRGETWSCIEDGLPKIWRLKAAALSI